jgi:hypothetical protein
MNIRIIKAPYACTKRSLLILTLFVYIDISDTFRPVSAIIREVFPDGLYLVSYICHSDIIHADSYYKYFFISLKLAMLQITFCS